MSTAFGLKSRLNSDRARVDWQVAILEFEIELGIQNLLHGKNTNDRNTVGKNGNGKDKNGKDGENTNEIQLKRIQMEGIQMHFTSR